VELDRVHHVPHLPVHDYRHPAQHAHHSYDGHLHAGQEGPTIRLPPGTIIARVCRVAAYVFTVHTVYTIYSVYIYIV
jgi:hypothetical protein